MPRAEVRPAVRDDVLSPYRHRQGVLHRAPASVKLLGAVLCVFVVVLQQRGAWLTYAAMAVGLLFVASLSRVPLRHLGRRLLIVEPFAVSVSLLALFQPNGLSVFATLLCKSTLCLFCVILLNSTTRFSDLLQALERFRVPSLLVTTLALTHRYLFLLGDEAGRMIRARRCRTFSAGRAFAWRAASSIAAQLFVRTSERAERVYSAMAARGWKT